MNYKLDVINIGNNLEKLDIKFPEYVTFFPENIETAKTEEDFIFTESIVELSKYFKRENFYIEFLGHNTGLYRSRKNADIYLPAIFFSISAIANNPNIISISLNILSNYIYDRLRGTLGPKTANIEFYIESIEKGKVTKIDYKGDAESLKDFEKIIKALK